MRKNARKRIALSVLAVALVAGISMPVSAAAPKVTMKSKKMYRQHTNGWTFCVPSKLPAGTKVMLNMYKDDPKESHSGNFDTKTFNSDEVFQGGTKTWFYTNQDKFEISGSETSTYFEKNLKPGTYKVDAYYYDTPAYKQAVEKKFAELKKTYPDVRIRTAWWGESFNEQCEYHNFVTGEYYSKPIATVFMSDYIVNAGKFTLNMDLNEPGISSAVKSTSVQLNLSKSYGTGYEIYRKVGSSYKKIATTTKNTYTDKNLTSKTKYNYKVRVYYKDRLTGKIIYGPYSSYECATKGSALNLKLTVQKTKNVKLTWSKVPGAKQYKVYRTVASSDTTAYSKGGAIADGFGKWELIKTLGSGKKTYTDKKTAVDCSYQYMVVAVLSKDSAGGDTDISDSRGVSFHFGDMNITADYKDAVGNRTIEWNKSYGAKGFIIEKKIIDPETKKVAWVEEKKLGASASKYTFKAKKYNELKPDANGKYDLTETYRISPFKDNGKIVGNDYEFTTTATLGMVKNVKAKKVANGIQVTWSKVDGAAYYQVYRIPASAHALNKTIKGYEVASYHSDEYNNIYSINPGGTLVTEYVGAKKPVAVDVKKWNAAIDAFAADTTGTVARPVFNYKLDETKTYYYQNYEYQRTQLTTTSVIDYAGEIFTGSKDYSGYWDQKNNKQVDQWATKPVEVRKNEDYFDAALPGTTYQYIVIAYAGQKKTWQDYREPGKTDEDAKNQFANATKLWVTTPGTLKGVEKTQDLYKYHTSSYTCASYGEANYSAVAAPSGKPAIKSATSSKKTVTIKLKKKVKGAVAYRIYRATKKKGKYSCVGITTSTTFKDSGLKVGKTYYYKVVPIATSESGEDIEGKASSVKSVKVKK